MSNAEILEIIPDPMPPEFPAELLFDSQFLLHARPIQGRIPTDHGERENEEMQTVARTLGMLVLLSASANAQTQPIQQAPQAQPASPQPQPSSQQPAVQSTPKLKEILVRPGNIPGVAPEHQEAARKSREAREKVAICQKEASDQKILPRYRTQFVLDCIDRKTN